MEIDLTILSGSKSSEPLETKSEELTENVQAATAKIIPFPSNTSSMGKLLEGIPNLDRIIERAEKMDW